jgi:tRNA threonylcarbamoyladenosine biosynthesis protein TsaE
MQWRTATAEETEAAAGRFAHARPQGREVFVVIYLRGDLGAGKTTWARGFLRACGVTALVRSPTYTLMELYDLGDSTAVHLDLYRLQDDSELEALGVRDWAQSGNLWLIEWPERGAQRLPAADVSIALSAASDAHEIVVSAATPLGESWLARLGA